MYVKQRIIKAMTYTKYGLVHSLITVKPHSRWLHCRQSTVIHKNTEDSSCTHTILR